MILDEKELVYSYKFKKLLIDFAQDLFAFEDEERIKYFEDNVENFFKSSSSQKILILGRAGTGKTTIKKIIFEGIDPKELLIKSLDPTRGLSPSVYSWLDLKIGLFDSSGQELESLLNNKEEYDLAFSNTDILIYIFDYTTWIDKSEEILAEIKKIKDIIERDSYMARVILFMHKIDLMVNTNREESLAEITSTLKKNWDFPIFFTSIHPEFIYSVYNAFYEILASHSIETNNIKTILDDSLADSSKTMFFVTNQNKGIISQTTSKDFNFSSINHIHKLIAQVTQTFEDMSNNDNIEHLIISGKADLNIIMKNLDTFHYKIKNLICISETLSANKLIWITGQINAKIKKNYYNN